MLHLQTYAVVVGNLCFCRFILMLFLKDKLLNGIATLSLCHLSDSDKELGI